MSVVEKDDFDLMRTVEEDVGLLSCSLFLCITLHHVMMTVAEEDDDCRSRPQQTIS